MTYTFRVRRHPLGVVVYRYADQPGELLIPGEDCCGVPVHELERIAGAGGIVEVDSVAARDCPLNSRSDQAISEATESLVHSD